jgi:hypothetical protein
MMIPRFRIILLMAVGYELLARQLGTIGHLNKKRLSSLIRRYQSRTFLPCLFIIWIFLSLIPLFLGSSHLYPSHLASRPSIISSGIFYFLSPLSNLFSAIVASAECHFFYILLLSFFSQFNPHTILSLYFRLIFAAIRFLRLSLDGGHHPVPCL